MSKEPSFQQDEGRIINYNSQEKMRREYDAVSLTMPLLEISSDGMVL